MFIARTQFGSWFGVDEEWFRKHVFYLCCAVITLISVHDAILLIVNQGIINEVEQNPLGSLLLNIAGGNVWLFVSVKLLTTSFVGTALIFLHEHFRSIAEKVIAGVATFQIGLLYYLTFH